MPTAKPTARFYHAIDIVDRAGGYLGSGHVNLYAPQDLMLGRSADIVLEIVIERANPDLFLNPAPSATPIIGIPRPTPSPMTIADSQFLEVREWMGAGMRGVDLDHFVIEPVPPSGLRKMVPNAVNWWKWNIRADSIDAVGENHLEAYVYLPNVLDNGTPFPEETNIIPFTITVLAPPTSTATVTSTSTSTPTLTPTATLTPTPAPTSTPTVPERIKQTSEKLLDTWVERLVAVGTLIGLLYAGYRFLKSRGKKRTPKKRK